jgi:hypothetical protein
MCSESLLGEVHNAKHILSVLLGIANPEVEPLLVASGICVYLHVQLVLARIHNLSLQ